VLAVGQTRRTTTIALSLAGPLVLFECLQIVFRNAAVEIPTHLFGIAFLGYTVFVIVQFLFKTNRVTANTICAAIFVYLLLGVLWSLELSIVEIIHPGSFTDSRQSGSQVIRFGGEHSVDALYFSFVTLTTLGYGDITPTSPIAKMLVCMEAVVGQLFLAILVARLVGLHIIHSTNPPAKDN